ncbi:MAG: hypothetical protein JWR10_2191, partial [Rubritepida sp.]|nr:hypothetical protein [Rubritepida sp.]
GNADAMTFLNWEANFLVGRFTSEAQGFHAHDGATYLLAISDPTTDAAPYTTWAEIGAQTEARGWSNGATGWEHSQGDYPQLALATLAGIYHLTGSAEAKAAYDTLIADAAPFSGTSDYERDPTFAITAPDASSPQTPVVQDPGHSNAAPDPTSGLVVAAPVGEVVSLAAVVGADNSNSTPVAGDVNGVAQDLAASLLTAPDDSFSFSAQPAGETDTGKPDVLPAAVPQDANQAADHILPLVDGAPVGQDLVDHQASADAAYMAAVELDGLEHANAALLPHTDAIFS